MERIGKIYTFALAFTKYATRRKNKGKKKAFFEKIYIDREVVQESSAAFLMW
ncbi:hypothetical protein HMPREF9296_1231 [Prevotella disiens FB035-09AN]|uniref:Uncharacterized protein n=1 Tax=Prevotella disiens FB035-09AN TaxID=866771 RepID=E1KPH7_9BACT|nr:hypothetical protein HMPREF9296_1231 [Prevotella disiens FB035-09AN]